MNVPRTCIAQEGNGTYWGAARLHAPIILAELQMVSIQREEVNCQPWVWPPDLLAKLERDQAEELVAEMWIMFERRLDFEYQDVEDLQLDLTRTIPRFLVLDNDLEDFTGVLDTEAGLLWAADEQLMFLTLVENWRLHPGMRTGLDLVELRQETWQFWKRFVVASGIYADDRDLRGWAE